MLINTNSNPPPRWNWRSDPTAERKSGVTIQINGYTDNVGKPADNLLLSENRAKSVVNYLKSKGIDGRRFPLKDTAIHNREQQ